MGELERTSPPTDVRRAIGTLLARIPERWSAYRGDDLTAIESQALQGLVTSGLAELRHGLRLSLLTEGPLARVTVYFTGQSGLAEALAPVAAALGAAAPGNEFPLHCEQTPPCDWRLTGNGVLAQRRPPAWIGDPGLLCSADNVSPHEGNCLPVEYPPVRGHGCLLRFRRLRPQTPVLVAIANPDECAQAIAAEFQRRLTRGAHEWTIPQQPLRQAGRLAQTEARLREFLHDRRERYEELVARLNGGVSAARRTFQAEFGPTAFARSETATIGDPQQRQREFQRLKTAVQHCPLYQQRIKPVLGGRPASAVPEADWELADNLIARMRDQMRSA